MNKLLAIAVLFVATHAVAAQRAEVLVLGTYHMANPGQDTFDVKADDVFSPKRQAEIAQLLAVLEKFHPTKVAVESAVLSNRIGKRYADYVAGKVELTRNEIDQIGLRVAKDLGLKTVYGVDADGDFPLPVVINYARASGRTKELDAIQSTFAGEVKEWDAYLASHTVLETLLLINSDETVAKDMAAYFRYPELGEPADWAGADLVSDWFRRNMRINANILRLIESPNERILVVFGSGHLGWLREDLARNPNVRLRKLEEFVK